MPIEWLLYPALGVVAGLLAGLLGVGGGLVLVARSRCCCPRRACRRIAMQAALATSLASVVATACGVGAGAPSPRRRAVAERGWLAPGLVPAAWLGSLVARRVDGADLRWFVVGYCVLAATAARVRPAARRAAGRRRARHRPAPTGLPLGLAGSASAACRALVGIGGGSMTVPLLVWRGVAPVRAVGTSSACGVVIGLSAAAAYASAGHVAGMPPASLGYVVLPAAIGIALASVRDGAVRRAPRAPDPAGAAQARLRRLPAGDGRGAGGMSAAVRYDRGGMTAPSDDER
jgi:uncharacterized membrane protein YfcA